jgi:predicted nucleotidyltransferase
VSTALPPSFDVRAKMLAGNPRARSAQTLEVEAFGVSFECIDLPTLIRIKEAAGRPKDLEAVAELRVLLQERK